MNSNKGSPILKDDTLAHNTQKKPAVPRAEPLKTANLAAPPVRAQGGVALLAGAQHSSPWNVNVHNIALYGLTLSAFSEPLSSYLSSHECPDQPMHTNDCVRQKNGTNHKAMFLSQFPN